MRKSRSTKEPSPAQHQATMNNLCLASFARLSVTLRKAGHPSHAFVVETAAATFRKKVSPA